MRRVAGIIMAVLLATAAGMLIGAKRLDDIAAARPDLALRSGADTYFIPSGFVRSGGWRIQLMRVAGCWDARDAAILAAAASISGCRSMRGVELALPLALLAPEVAQAFHKPQLKAVFWPSYEPPDEDIAALADALAGRGDFAARKIVLHEEWKLWRVESAASPWVYLLFDQPRSRDVREAARLYAGRCYRPVRMSDAGVTCSFALHAGASAVIEFALGPDEVMSFVPLREALLARAAEWRREARVSVKIPALGQDGLGAGVLVERDLVGRRLGVRGDLARLARGR
jgi:hypothetical protein